MEIRNLHEKIPFENVLIRKAIVYTFIGVIGSVFTVGGWTITTTFFDHTVLQSVVKDVSELKESIKKFNKMALSVEHIELMLENTEHRRHGE